VATARILLVSGSTRGGSTNTALLRTAQAVAPAEITTVLYEGLAGLPAFNPDDAALKRDLAERMSDDREGYTAAKTQFISRVESNLDETR